MRWLALFLVVAIDAVVIAKTAIPAAYLVPAAIAAAGWLIWLLVSDLRNEHRALRDLRRQARNPERPRRPDRDP